ncbi:MAG: hypothetical protein GWM90_15300 [Gemmatimonadetes bacterium]|nr:hypothetical protein [Gemmatimonadota bacterium]NIQ55564.1 hypothetical protein [Gemmatimonadota bacterium]NIU75772.1 hypothetical protein [Gammaproteobacteria bacterium]NIX45419.1 hypothetical protein [Gemmatimonadota bacterium]NIY09706.1 hypothetical protein [Gemmatimonadota bacterium]
MKPRTPTAAWLVATALSLMACGDAVSAPEQVLQPGELRPGKSIFHRCKPHLAPPSTPSTADDGEGPLLYVTAADQAVRLDFGEASVAARFHTDVVVWETGEACGEGAVRPELTAGTGPSAPWGDHWLFVGGDVRVTLDGDRPTALEVHGEVCSTPDRVCRPASLLAHELTHVAPQRDGEAVLLDLRLVSGADEASFHAHGHLDYLKKVGDPAT